MTANEILWGRGSDELRALTRVTRKRLDSKDVITEKPDAPNLNTNPIRVLSTVATEVCISVLLPSESRVIPLGAAPL